MRRSRWLLVGWILSAGVAAGMRAWNAIAGPLFYGYDAWGHIAYVFFLDMYRAIPYADQGWSYFHPPLHYLLGWLLMQPGDPDFLIIGLSLLGGAASLGVAALAALLVRAGLPQRPGLSLLAFSAVAFLPVHVYVSPMPGNEMTATFFASAAVYVHVRNEMRAQPSWRRDLATGVLAAAALLSKVSGAVPCIVIAATTFWHFATAASAGSLRARLPRLALRSAAILAPVLLLAGPYYARNVIEFGTPIKTSYDFPAVATIQATQPPGERSLADFFYVSPKLFEDSVADAPHMLRSVWATTYLNVWFDTYNEGQLPDAGVLTRLPELHRLTIGLGLLGLLPTALALAGAAIATRRVLARGESAIDLAMLLLAAATLASYVFFAVRIPTWAALKASYLLNLSLPFAWFVARATCWLGGRGVLRRIAPMAICALAVASTATFTTGAMLRRHWDSMQMASVRAHFGDFASTRELFNADAPQSSYLDARAAVELLDGRPGTARRYYQRTQPNDPAASPYHTNRLAVAFALDHQRGNARALLDAALAREPLEELLVNRAVLRASEGDLEGAEADLRTALECAPALPPAWSNLAVVLERSGRSGEAARARERASGVAPLPPRAFPYGVGDGYLYESGAGQRWMLLLGPGPALSLYAPPRSRNRR